MSNNNNKSNTGRPTTTHWSSHGGQRVYHTTTHGSAIVNNGDYFAGGSGNQAPIPALDNLHVRLATAQRSGRTHFHPVPLPRVSPTSHTTSGKASFNPWAKYYPKPPSTNASSNTSQPKATRKGSPTQKAGSASNAQTTLVPQDDDDDDDDFVDTDSESVPGDDSRATQPSQPAESTPSSSTTDRLS